MSSRSRTFFLPLTTLILILSTLAGCGPTAEELAAVDCEPLPKDGWLLSSPAEERAAVFDPEVLCARDHRKHACSLPETSRSA